MIECSPPRTGANVVDRAFAVVVSALRFAQSAQDVANALAALFTPGQAGAQTLTLGATAPDTIQTLTPTRWVQIVEADGQVTTLAGWR